MTRTKNWSSPFSVQSHQFGHVVTDASLQHGAVLICLSENVTNRRHQQWEEQKQQTNKENKQQQSLFTHSKCCLIWVSSAYLEMPLINKVRFTCMTKNKRFTRLCTGFGIYIFYDESVCYQVVLLVVHLRRVSPHAVDGQEQIHEGKGRMEPQKICPEKQLSSVRISNRNTTTSNLWKYLSNICGSETCN